jgi:hypothetical protein
MNKPFITAMAIACAAHAYSQSAIAAPEAGVSTYKPLSTDGSLRNTVSRWANQAGMKVVWTAPDYPLTQKALALPEEKTFADGLRGLSSVYSKVSNPFNVSLDDKKRLIVTPLSAEQIAAAAKAKSEAAQAAPTPEKRPVELALADKKIIDSSTAVAQARSPAEVVPTAKPAAAPKQWVINSGDSVKETLKAWAKKAEWQFVWMVENDYISMAHGEWGGDFQNGVRELFSALPISIGLTPELTGNKLLYVTK